MMMMTMIPLDLLIAPSKYCISDLKEIYETVSWKKQGVTHSGLFKFLQFFTLRVRLRMEEFLRCKKFRTK